MVDVGPGLVLLVVGGWIRLVQGWLFWVGEHLKMVQVGSGLVFRLVNISVKVGLSSLGKRKHLANIGLGISTPGFCRGSMGDHPFHTKAPIQITNSREAEFPLGNRGTPGSLRPRLRFGCVGSRIGRWTPRPLVTSEPCGPAGGGPRGFAVRGG